VPFSEAINDDKPPPTCHSANSNLRGNLKGKKKDGRRNRGFSRFGKTLPTF